jgi:hypothetical protein
VAYENIGCILKWPNLKAKIGKMKKSKFGRIDSWNMQRQVERYISKDDVI